MSTLYTNVIDRETLLTLGTYKGASGEVAVALAVEENDITDERRLAVIMVNDQTHEVTAIGYYRWTPPVIVEGHVTRMWV